MRRRHLWESFQEDWKRLLRQRGHRVTEPEGVQCVLASRDRAGKRYRWLLLLARGESRGITSAERRDVEHHLRQARASKQQAYLVIRFQKPQCKVVAMPADRALRRRRILPGKGGIPWPE